jgi:hypothetical protein
MARRHSYVGRRIALFTATALIAPAVAIVVTATPAAAVPVVGNPVNATLLAGNEDESAIAVNPNNNQQIAVLTNGVAGDNGLPLSVSTDGGQNWTRTTIATGTGAGGDGFPAACCDPTLSWDNFGNLFLGYLQRTPRTIELLVSTDTGATWTNIGPVDTGAAGSLDQPTVVAGEGAVWVTWRDDSGGIAMRGRSVTAAGVFGAWLAEQDVSITGNFGDIAIGPNGEVMVTYQTPSGGQGPSNILVNLDADGLGSGGIGAAVTATATNVGGFDALPAQQNRTVDAEPGLAWDRSGGANDGRVYLVYTDEAPDESNDFDIWVRSSNNNGATWGAPVRVNDDGGTRSNMLPKIALDQTNGDLGVTFYTARNDDGTGPNANDLNGVANDDVQLYGAFSFAAGATWSANLQISDGTTDGDVGGGQQLGDYTGSAFHDGILYPSWADSSNSTGDNPSGTAALDVYTAQVFADNDPPAVSVAPVNANEGATFTVTGLAGDPDGDPLTFGWAIVPAGGTDAGAACTILSGATTLTPSVRCSDDGSYTATLTATGSPGGPVSASGTLTIANVSPDVTGANNTPSTIDEGDSTTFAAEFSDPGFNDTYTASIDWGIGGSPDAVTAVITSGGPPADQGTISGSHTYGDDGSFTVTGQVVDDDLGTDQDTAVVTVRNVAPTALIEDSGATLINGVPTFISSAGQPITFSGNTKDPGSDDLVATWDWDDGPPAPDESTTYLVNPPATDPDPSPTVQPRDVTDTKSHTFGDACFYDVVFGSADDDGGSSTDSAAIVVVGNFDETRSHGYFKNQIDKQRRSAAEIQCLLDIAGHMSSVFNELRDASTPAAASAVLTTSGTSSMRDLLDAQLLAAWLNFADGRVGLADLVDTNFNHVVDTPFGVAIANAESVRANPLSTRVQLERQKDILEGINVSGM